MKAFMGLEDKPSRQVVDITQPPFVVQDLDEPPEAQPRWIEKIPVMRAPERYDHFVIRTFGTSERVPERLFISGRIYWLASARLERQPEWLPHEFMISCKFSLERKSDNATRR